ncbi:Golgi apparatus membrane protein [Venturia nashicola]|nr:Golgi apparatus membrane protein [Venturia nashicola]
MAINFNPFKPTKSTKHKKVNHSKRYHRKRTRQVICTTTEIIIVVEKLLASKLLLRASIPSPIPTTPSQNTNLANTPANRDWKENSILDVFRGSITKFVAYNVFAGFFASTTFAVVSIFDRVWPHWPEATRARRTWFLCALLAVLFMLISSVYFSVTVANNLVSMVRVRDGFIPSLDREALAYVTLVLTWVATCGTVWSCCLLVSCALRVKVHGPLSKYGREMEAEEIRGKVAENTERELEAVGGSPGRGGWRNSGSKQGHAVGSGPGEGEQSGREQ